MLASLVTAAPANLRQVPNYPPSSLANGFTLVVNVTDPAKDLTPSVNGYVFTTAHTGAGLNTAIVSPGDPQQPGRVFYLNGTTNEVRNHQSTVITDGGLPPAPYGITILDSAQETEHAISVNVGQRTVGVGLATFPDPYSYLIASRPGSYLVCNRDIPYYQQAFTVVQWVDAVVDEDTSLYVTHVPYGCTAVRLIPQCTTLDELPEGSYSSHEFANTVKCYNNVSGINWTQYGP